MNANKAVMDAFDAPQWTDFTSSPQVSDDFFSRLHPEHELEYHKSLKQHGTLSSKHREKQLFSTMGESDFESVLDSVQITPIKVLSPLSKSHKDEKMSSKETTVGNLLLEAMSNLELSAKKGRLNQSMANSSINLCKTPKTTDKRITRSMSARKNYENDTVEVSLKVKSNESNIESPRKKVYENNLESVSNIESSTECDSVKNDSEPCETAKKIPSRIVTSFEKQTTAVSSNEKNNSEELDFLGVKLLETESNEEQPPESQNSDQTDTVSNENELPPSRIVTSFSLGKSKEPKKLDSDPVKKRPHVLTSIRRQSLIKQKRNDQYISLAEAVSKFQKGTPKRFRSVSSKNPNLGSKVISKQVTLKITRPVSPVLTSKNRVRPIKALKGKKEIPELKKIRNGPVKADPKAISTFKNTDPVKSITKKPANTSKSVQLTKKGHQFSSSESLTTTQPRKACHASFSSLQDLQHLKSDQIVQKKVVSTIVSTDDAKLAVKEVELGHFGIPTEPCHKPTKFTRTLPFSFEVRNKELQEKKERRLKKLQSEEIVKTKKTEIPTKPLQRHVTKEPGTVKVKITPLKNPKESSVKKTTPCPFSFEERDKRLIKKKQDLIKEAFEKERKGREFHANPVPEFRPVIVRGRSRENIKVGEKTPEKQEKTRKPLLVPKACVLKRNLFTTKKIDNQENKKPITLRSNSESDINVEKSSLKMNSNKDAAVLAELNTNKRARERKEFYDKLKRREIEEGTMRKKEEEERLLRQKSELAELRKMTEIRARPMPQYKPIAIIRSNKVLTDPQSPAWAHKTKM